MLIDAHRNKGAIEQAGPEQIADGLGLNQDAAGLLSWDVFEAVLTPGDVIALLSWRDHDAADVFRRSVALPEGARLRQVRIVRDYGMYDRRENPQYYPEVGTKITTAL
jgi:hypothetical protein